MNDSNQDLSFSKDSRANLVAIMLGMTVCFSTLWRFPYQVASFGGLGYITIYLVMLVFFVYPALTAEWGLGRFTNAGPEKAYENLHFPKAVSYLLFFVVFAIGSYFIVWVGWILEYAFKGITDPNLVSSNTSSTSYFTSNIVDQPVIQLFFAVIVLILLAPALLKGTRAIEKISTVIVPVFFVFLSFITFIVLIQPGIAESVITYATSVNMGQINAFTFIAALGQAFFSLCLGGTYMVLYANYTKRTEKQDIPLNAGLTILGNTVASILSMLLVFGIIVISTLGLDNFTSAGPGLLFSAIPEAFKLLSVPVVVKQFLLSAFFVMFFLSAFLPMVAVLEVLVAFLTKKFNISRKTAYSILVATLSIASIPSILSPLEGGFLYNLDIFIGGIGSVLGSLIALVAFGWFVSKSDVLTTVNFNSSKVKLGEKWYFIMKYVAPFATIFVILYALSDVIVGYFTLDAIPDTSYILYPSIITFIPILTVICVICIGVVYYLNRKSFIKHEN